MPLRAGRRLALLLSAAATLACASTASRDDGQTPRTDRSVLTQAQILERRYTNLYDAVAALRSQWLRPRGMDSFTSPSQVWVYFDDTRLGDVESLRLLQPQVISTVRFIDAVSAQARYGVGHAAGVILVSSWPADKSSLATPPPPEFGFLPAADERDAGRVAPPATLDSTSYVEAYDGAGRFPLAVRGRPAPVYVSSQDFPGVVRAANDLRLDLGRVTGAEPAVVADATPTAGRVVVVGTIGRSPLVDALVRDRKLDVEGIAGRWETHLVQVVERPWPGVEQALVVAGSDKRGTIYGVYDLSQEIGVSPWHWWADVPVRSQPSLYVLPGRHSRGTPAVKYRGIFINDEAPAFSGWTREKFGGFNQQVYTKVFELILRMKGNYLWPAMWGNAFADDDTANGRLADEYGVVMGTSHHEPLGRAHDEWRRYGTGPWNYERNDSTLREFWRGSLRRMGTRENVLTLGMRGDGDEPMTEGTATALLERIVADQRRIIEEVTGRPAAGTPQLWALYKEVQDYYDKGMKVPDDVTLLFADDNWGNVRRLPKPADRDRPGGFGVYYHFDYVGGPRNYKWLNTNPIARVWEQMHLAHALGADRIWIVNVGDIKPMELPTQFFLDYAWNPDAIPASALPAYTRRWAARSFGAEPAADVARQVTTHLQLASRRKPELLDTATYSLVNYREAERVLAEWAALRDDARRTRARLPAGAHDAYYQLVQHPIEAFGNLHELYVTAARNRLYARQGRAATNLLADSARRLFARDAEISAYYNDTLAGGKWSHMMDQTHIGYTYWQEPPRNVMPRVDLIQVPEPAELAVMFEGQAPAGPPGAGAPPGAAPREPALPQMDPFLRQRRWIDVYNRGRTPFRYTARAAEPWVTVSEGAGTIETERRLWVAVDWERAPVGRHRVPVTITGPDDRRVVVQAVVHNPAAPKRDAVSGFVESEGHVAIEAEHWSRAVNANGVTWQVIPGLGRTLSGVAPFPVTAPAQRPGGGSPRLEYRLHLFSAGEVTVRVHVSPTHDVLGAGGLRYAVSLDNEAPQTVNLHADGSSSGVTDGNRAWERSVAENIKVLETKHRVATPGAHVLKLWMVDPGVVVQRIVVDAGGLRPSYLGPPESFHRGTNGSTPASASPATRAAAAGSRAGR